MMYEGESLTLRFASGVTELRDPESPAKVLVPVAIWSTITSMNWVQRHTGARQLLPGGTVVENRLPWKGRKIQDASKQPKARGDYSINPVSPEAP